VQPDEVDAFLVGLPVGRIPGVGKVTDAQLAALGIRTIGELRAHSAGALERRFGKYGRRLHELARGIDERPVEPNQPTQSISAEDTFEADQALDAMEPKIRSLAAKVWAALQHEHRVPRTVVLKLKTHDFRVLTRSHTPKEPPASAAELAELALALRARVGRPPGALYRLVGVGLSGFRDPDERQPELF
jgi:DNA polymerase-4